MTRRLITVALIASCCPPEAAKQVTTVKPPVAAQHELALPGESHLRNVRQLTFGADNAEAYWAFSGDRLIFQTNHAPYKCDQIEIMSAQAAPTPGGGKPKVKYVREIEAISGAQTQPPVGSGQ